MIRDNIVSVRLTENEHELLKKMALQKNKTISDVVRDLINKPELTVMPMFPFTKTYTTSGITSTITSDGGLQWFASNQ